jgi:hypothetical protein
LLAQPFGQLLVGAVGLGFVAFAVSQFYKAYTTKFREKLKTNEMDEKTQTFATRFGQADCRHAAWCLESSASF